MRNRALHGPAAYLPCSPALTCVPPGRRRVEDEFGDVRRAPPGPRRAPQDKKKEIRRNRPRPSRVERGEAIERPPTCRRRSGGERGLRKYRKPASPASPRSPDASSDRIPGAAHAQSKLPPTLSAPGDAELVQRTAHRLPAATGSTTLRARPNVIDKTPDPVAACQSRARRFGEPDQT